MNVPKTLKERLEADREYYYSLRQAIQGAILELIGGESVVSYTLGGRSVSRSRADLGAMKEQLKYCDQMIDEIEAQLCGRSIRGTSQNVFISPDCTYWRP